jgi:hypothetical protein
MEVRDSWTSIRAITVAGLTPWRPANGHLPINACHVAKRSHHTSSTHVDARDIARGCEVSMKSATRNNRHQKDVSMLAAMELSQSATRHPLLLVSSTSGR